jgi:hypothetical protein
MGAVASQLFRRNLLFRLLNFPLRATGILAGEISREVRVSDVSVLVSKLCFTELKESP